MPNSILMDAPVGTPYVDDNLVLWVSSGAGTAFRLDHLLCRVRADEGYNIAYMGDFEMLDAFCDWVMENDPE